MNGRMTTTKQNRRSQLIGGVAAAVAMVFVAISPARAATGELRESFFNSMEDKKTTLERYGKWTGAVGKYFADKAKNEGSCASTDFNKCHYLQWRSFIEGARGKPPGQQLVEVNSFLNTRRYITDPVNWGVKDYWETPSEFFTRDGDCEDYAITKYLTLRDLGFPVDQLRVVVVKDLNLKISHAVLVVFLDGKTFLLDNQVRKVVETKKVRHYKPIYSLNEEAWWRHKKKK